MTIFASLPLSPHVEAVCFDFPSRCNLSSPWCVPPSHFLSSIVPLLLCPHSLQTTNTEFSCNFLVLVNLFFFTIVRDERMLDEVWFPTERHSPTCVSHSHCTGFDKLCKHCVTKHHFRDTLTCTLTLREGGSPIFLPVMVISHCNVVHVYDWFKSLILEWLWSNIQQECIWGTVSHYDFFCNWALVHQSFNPKPQVLIQIHKYY